MVSLPNVLITAHQSFFTKEARTAIAVMTPANLSQFEDGLALVNEVVRFKSG